MLIKKVLLIIFLLVSNFVSYSQSVSFIELICFEKEETFENDNIYFKIDGKEEKILFKNIKEKDIIDLSGYYKNINFKRKYITVQLWEDDLITPDLLGEIRIRITEKGINRKIFNKEGAYYVLTYMVN